jgi:RNA methyltransferase, TrmH family
VTSRSGPVDSLQNSHVAAARSLLTRKGRTAASAFLVEGPHAVSAALAAPQHQVREVFITDAAADREVALLRAVAEAGVTLRVVTERVLASLGDTVTPQGVVASVHLPSTDLATALAGRPRLVVVLDRVADPGNAGTVIRTADAAGAAALIATAGSVDVWSGKCVRSSAGSLFHLPVVTGVATEAALEQAKAAGCAVLATAPDGAEDLDDLIDGGFLAAPTAWLFGNEAHGLSAAVRATADRVVRLPVYGRAESLNLAATAAICLYASAHGQRPGSGRH